MDVDFHCFGFDYDAGFSLFLWRDGKEEECYFDDVAKFYMHGSRCSALGSFRI